MRETRRFILTMGVYVSVCMMTGCEGREDAPLFESAAPEHPNIVFVVWDTVRADQLSLYGHARETTPFLERWAKQARVYEDCVAVGSTTVPSHASMFTGLMPSEHGTTNAVGAGGLPVEFKTLAELLKDAGYDTYSFVSNCYLQAAGDQPGVMRGFDLIEYPWDESHRMDALRIMFSKVIPYDQSNALAQKIHGGGRLTTHVIKDCGDLVLPSLLKWLETRESERPFFAFLNFMEAHAPLIPPIKYRRRFMTQEQVDASFRVDRTFPTIWEYIFGFHDYTPEENELTELTYDAALLELDEIFQELIETLDAQGYLENTLIVLVGDHGEHLGQHHRMDHQFSVYQPILHVPLVIYDPARFVPGRDRRPVMNVDLFPTLLARVGLPCPVETRGVDLLQTPAQRPRLGEYPSPLRPAFESISKKYPDFNPQPWDRSLRAFYRTPFKFIEGSDGRNELYDLTRDPDELHDLIATRPDLAAVLQRELNDYLSQLNIKPNAPDMQPSLIDPDQRKLLEMTGYLESESEPSGRPTNRP